MSPIPPAAGRAKSPAFRYLKAALIVLILASVGYWIADWKWPAGPRNGTTFSGSVEAASGLPHRFKVATFNIHGGSGSDGRMDLKRTAECLRDVDLAGMNEVHAAHFGDAHNQAEQLGQLLEMGWLFAPTEVGWTGPQFGQGVVCRSAVKEWRVEPYPRVVGNGYRNFVECHVPFGPDATGAETKKSLVVLVTHLDRKSDRQDQLRTIIQRFLNSTTPVIVMGDLNSKRTEPQLIDLAKQPGVIDCFGRFAQEPLVSKRIDWIFARGLKCLDANLEATDASDHPWGWAELELDELVGQ